MDLGGHLKIASTACTRKFETNFWASYTDPSYEILKATSCTPFQGSGEKVLARKAVHRLLRVPKMKRYFCFLTKRDPVGPSF